MYYGGSEGFHCGVIAADYMITLYSLSHNGAPLSNPCRPERNGSTPQLSHLDFPQTPAWYQQIR